MDNNVFQAVMLDCVGLVLTLLVTVRIKHMILGRRMGGKILLWAARVICLYTVFHALGMAVDGKTFPGGRVIAMVSNMVVFLASIIIMYLLMLYLDYYLYHSLYRLKRSTKPIVVALAIILLAVVSNPLTNLVFTIDEANRYVSGIGYYIMIIVNFLFIVYIGMTIFLYRSKFGGMRFFPVMSFVLPIIVCLLVGMVTEELLSIMPLGISISLCALVMGALEEIVYKDSITGFYNEFYFHYLMNTFEKGKTPYVSGIIFEFENMNAIMMEKGYSHAVKDVETLAEIIQSELPEGCEVMYMGGGRFLLLTKVSNLAHLRLLEGNVEESVNTLENPEIKLVCGHALLNDKKETDVFVRELYEALGLAETK